MNGLEWILLPVVMAVSFALSGSETAFFGLDEDERNRAGLRVRALLDRPQALLIALLLANLVVNIFYFSLIARLADGAEGYEALWWAGGALGALVVCCEILPKAIAWRVRERFAAIVALPAGVLVRVTAPVRFVIEKLLDLLLKAFGLAAREQEGVDADELGEVLARSRGRDSLDAREAGMLAEIVELEDIRVKEILVPRVDMIYVDLEQHDEEARWFHYARALSRRLTWVPVVEGGPDRVVGQVHLRDVLARPDAPLEDLILPVHFVPEVASVLDLLRTFKESGAAEAIVVDEHGGTAGLVTIENVFEEIVGDLRVEGERPSTPVEEVAPGHFRVAGDLLVRDWNEAFGRSIVPEGFETIGGFATALLGRVPKVGDEVRSGGLACRVTRMSGRRVVEVEVWPSSELDSGGQA
ncbi:MAG: hypothetical protein RIT40_732 [Planctomycetota bacterium]|jgi:CBS domain containing-hemolysin-like protein